MLPRAAVPPNHISFVDALFTSASAVCVTGLTVVDTGSYFSPLGHTIILALIQVGGIGIMTITTFLALFFRKGVGIRERIILQDMTNVENVALLSTALRNIIAITFFIEIIGAIFLAVLWTDQGWSSQRLCYNAIFHSVSAFCNAGFALFPDSLMRFRSSPFVILVFAFLITTGGLGFLTLMDLGGKRILTRERKKSRLKVHTRLVLITSALLFLFGFFSYLFIEHPSEKDGLFTGLLSAIFTSVTARTAGFNTVNTASLSVPLTLILIILMFIGASPGSTGGGIKTTTFAVLWWSIIAIIAGKKRIVIMGRNIPFFVLNRAIVVLAVSIIVNVVATFVLTLIEKKDFVDIIFEVVSAFGTVGLSRGITPGLHTISKIVITACMFIGRMGILTVAFAITAPKEEHIRISYPSEIVLVG